MAGELAAGDAIRYASMNVASVFKYGSVEFRSLRSTRDWGRILTWVKALTYIKEAANRFADPKAVVENISLNGAVEFARSVLKDLYEVFNTVDMDTKLYSAIRNVQAMAFNLDFNKAEAMNLRFDRNPSYNNLSEKYAQASNSWEKFRDKKGTGEMPLEEPLPQQDLLPVLEVTNRGDRPFVDGEEVEGEDDVDWWGRNSPRVRLRQGAPMPIAEPRQIWADLQVDQAPNNAAVQAQAPGWLRMWDNIGQQGFPAIPEHAQQERLPRQNEAAQQGQPLNDQAFSLIIIDEQPVENPPRRIRPWVRDRT